jgi:hemolysin activation/secretion protein
MPVFARLGLLSLALVLLALPLATLAQTLPNSGQILQQVQAKPAQQPQARPGLMIESPAPDAAADSTPFAVTHLQIDGSSAFDNATLHALVAEGEGRTLTLTELSALAQRITDYYRAHGYPLARALVPAQELTNGIVHITVIEARYDQVQLDNRSRVGDGLLRATLAPLRPGDVVTGAALDRSLLLLGDLPGVSPRATLSPGASAGSSTLDVVTEAAPMLQGSAFMDDAGSRYTGRLRVGANVDINNPLHHGDQLSLAALTAGHDMRYGRLAYQFTVNGWGSRLGAAYSALAYALGGPLDALGAHGTAQVASGWLLQPLLRHRNGRLDVRLQFDRSQLRDRIDTTALRNDRHSNRWTASVLGQHGDAFAGGGFTSASLTVGHGQLGFERGAAASEAADAATAGTQGSYTRWSASVARLQSINTTTRLYASVAGQHSNRNLDSSEQFLLGGPGSVRGYDVSSVAGASGWLGTLELRHDLDWRCAGQCEGSVFVDHGSVRINADPWSADRNHLDLRSAGVGFNWIGTRQWQAQVQLAVPLGDAPALLGKRNGARVWLQVVRGF